TLPPCNPAEPRRRASSSGQAGGWRRWRRSRIRVFSWSSTKEEACDPLVHGYGPALSQGCRFPLQLLVRRVARTAEDLDRSEVDESCEPANGRGDQRCGTPRGFSYLRSPRGSAS